jgi:type I restriction enzyme S subunit
LKHFGYERHFKYLKEKEIPLPDLPTQRKIAGILSAYDDLIENNLRRIKILEQMAQSLYREWFVHFRFPGHESATFKDSELGRIPEGWEVRKILDYSEVVYGFAFKSKQFNTDGEGLPVVRIRDVPKGRSVTFTQEEGKSKHRISNGDILVGMDGDFHMTMWSGGNAWQNQRVAKFVPKEGMGNHLLYRLLEAPISYFDSTITGTTVAHLGDKHIQTIKFAAPPADLLKRASAIFEPLSEQQQNLRRRNQTLRRTRELLLPKLLSP